MKNTTKHAGVLALSAGLWFGLNVNPGTAIAGAGHDGGHGGGMQNMPHAGEMEHGSGSHAHDRWVDPPEPYAQRRSHRWDDVAAVDRGRDLFEANCAACHGSDGSGGGPLARALEHPPADLTQHLHGGQHNAGDAYLFWRVSEGGTVAPFKDQDSAMPAFKDLLTVGERWDVLAYVHQAFHRKSLGSHARKHEKAQQHGS